MTRNRYVAVAGTMGVGKSTVARLLAHKLGFTLMPENFADNQFLPRFYKDMKRWAFHSQTFFLLEKAKQTLETKALLVQGKSIVQDTPIIQDVQSYAKAQFVLGNMNEAEFALYTKIYTSFVKRLPQPDLIVYLDGVLATFKRRIRSRYRQFEQQVPDAYLTLLDKLNRKWVRCLNHTTVLRIKTDRLNLVDNQRDIRQFLGQVTTKLQNRGRFKLNGLAGKLKNSRAILMCGLPGSGKSTLARQLAKRLGARLLVSDKIREEVFGSVRYDLRGDLAVLRLKPKYYKLLSQKAVQFLLQGEKVVIDASNMDQQRLTLVKQISRVVSQKQVAVVVVKPPKQVLANRMRGLSGKANNREDIFTAWKRVYGYYEEHLQDGSYFWPQKSEGIQIIEVPND
ncbi:MAG: deoxynucleoside kinase [uncultured bacterium]|nr:MAG: deoxynucleoside kinase [uncultured bacterium]